jgi:IPT/TIG domain/Secretion system C-terminal sorting domain
MVTTPLGTASAPGFLYGLAPTITSFTPTSGATFASITITGTNFTGATAVSFGGVGAQSFTVNSSTSITATVWLGASGSVSVTAPGGTASLAGFTYIPPAPTIISFSPQNGVSGTLVTISGTNFTGATAVSFGGVATSSFTVVGPSLITATVGGGASGSVSITTAGGTASQAGFTFIQPVITSFTPTSGAAGTTITITGTNLTGATVVSFGGMAASSFTVVNATTITAVVGAGTSGSVSVTTPNGTATLAGFVFIPAPVISSFTPTNAVTGGTVTITGTNFTNASAVSFAGTPASSFIVVSSTTITAVVGSGASGSVNVTTPGGTATLAGFTYTIVTSTGGPSGGNSKDLVIYPNPAHDILVVRHPAAAKEAEMKWIDITGRTVKRLPVARSTTETTVNIAELARGIYKLLWTDGKKQLRQTIVVL